MGYKKITSKTFKLLIKMYILQVAPITIMTFTHLSSVSLLQHCFYIKIICHSVHLIITSQYKCKSLSFNSLFISSGSGNVMTVLKPQILWFNLAIYSTPKRPYYCHRWHFAVDIIWVHKVCRNIGWHIVGSKLAVLTVVSMSLKSYVCIQRQHAHVQLSVDVIMLTLHRTEENSPGN